MNTFENGMFGAWTEQDTAYRSNIEWQKQANLAEYEKELINDNGEHPWWSFFDGGVQDENGVTWAVYNRWCDEIQTSGWKVICCPDGQAEFREIPVTQVVRQEVYPAMAGRDGLTTFQLHIHDEATGLTNNDVLNVLLYHNNDKLSPQLHLWSQVAAMSSSTQLSRGALQGSEDYSGQKAQAKVSI